MIELSLEQPDDAAELESLYDLVFGSDRHQKAVYRLRDDACRESRLCRVVREEGILRGGIRYFRVAVTVGAGRRGRVPSLLLGPLAVDPDFVGRGLGLGLMKSTLADAVKMGHGTVILVGDQDYYGRVGFSRDLSGNLVLPGLKDRHRLLARELVPGSASALAGEIIGCGAS